MMAAVQANVVPPAVELNATLVAVALHIVCEDGVADPTGTGLTVTVSLTAVPEQPFAEAMIV